MIYGASSALGQVINFILVPLYTHHLTKTDYGTWAMLNIVLLLFVPLANLGMSNTVFRRFNACKDEEERKEVLSTGLFSVVGSTVLLGVLCLTFVTALTGMLTQHKDGVLLMQLTILTAMINSIGAITMVILRADRLVRTAAVMNILQLLVSISVTIVLVAWLQIGLLGAVVGILAGAIVGTTAQFYITRKAFRLEMRVATWRAMLSYGLPFVPHQVQAVLLTVFGQFVVLNRLGEDEGGLYRLAVMFTVPFAFVVHAVQKAWVPFKFQIHARDEDPAGFFRTAVTYYFAGTTYLWVGMSAWGPLLLLVMADAKFHKAALLVPIIAAIPLSEGLYFMLGTGIELTNNTRTLPLASFLGLVTVVCTALPLVSALGATGAALGTIIGWVVMAVAIYLLSQRYFRVPYDWPTLFAFLGGSALCVLLSYQIHITLNIPGRIVFALGLSLVYPVLVTLVLLRSPTERGRMREIGKRLKALRKKKQSKPTVDTATSKRTDEPSVAKKAIEDAKDTTVDGTSVSRASRPTSNTGSSENPPSEATPLVNEVDEIHP